MRCTPISLRTTSTIVLVLLTSAALFLTAVGAVTARRQHHRPQQQQQQQQRPYTDAECCDAGRQLFSSSGGSCEHHPVSIDDRPSHHSPGKSSSTGESDDTIPMSASSASCAVISTVCCLAERRQVQCRRGIEKAMRAGQNASLSRRAGKNDFRSSAADGVRNECDLGDDGVSTNDTEIQDARECCECCRLGRLVVQSAASRPGSRRGAASYRRSSLGGSPRPTCEPPLYYTDQCRLTYTECCTTQQLAPVETWNRRRKTVQRLNSTENDGSAGKTDVNKKRKSESKTSVSVENVPEVNSTRRPVASKMCRNCTEKRLACRRASNGSVNCVSAAPRDRKSSSSSSPTRSTLQAVSFTTETVVKDNAAMVTTVSNYGQRDRRPTVSSPVTTVPISMTPAPAGRYPLHGEKNSSQFEREKRPAAIRDAHSLPATTLSPSVDTTDSFRRRTTDRSAPSAVTSSSPGTRGAIAQFTSPAMSATTKSTTSRARVSLAEGAGSVTRPAPNINDHPTTPPRQQQLRQRNSGVGRCQPGFAFDATTSRCQDIDECQTANRCPAALNVTCRNTVGSFACVCTVGFLFNPRSRKCEDEDECAASSTSRAGVDSSTLCNDNEQCVNTIGSFDCRPTSDCQGGYRVDPITFRCVDIDECALAAVRRPCRSGSSCVNVPGSYSCVAMRREGYQDGSNPGPGDCPVGSSTCRSRHTSHNSFQAVSDVIKIVECSNGTRLDPSLKECIDIDECIELPSACGTDQQCYNTPGSFMCRDVISCGNGYRLNDVGTRCDDIDECAEAAHNCSGQMMICVNRPGTFLCRCRNGYQINGVTGSCEDIDECRLPGGNVCAANARCENTRGSFECICHDGFRMDANTKTCRDVDECELRSGICHQVCRNTYGSFHCSCYDGYQLSSNGRTCVDIDECQVWSSGSHSRPGAGSGGICLGLCHNVPGSYVCSCPPGYQMSNDGRTCLDIDECTDENYDSYNAMPVDCSGPDELCVNTRGGYLCHTIRCPVGFIKAPIATPSSSTPFLSDSGTDLNRKYWQQRSEPDDGEFSFTRVTYQQRGNSTVQRHSARASRTRSTSATVSARPSATGRRNVLHGQDVLKSVATKPIEYFSNDESGIVCLKVQCRVNDVVCMMNLTRSVQWQHVSLPTVEKVEEPIVFAHVQTVQVDSSSAPPDSRNPEMTLSDRERSLRTSFTIVAGNRHGLFDVIAATDSRESGSSSSTTERRKNSNMNYSVAGKGAIRLLRPVYGPAEHVLTLQMDVRSGPNAVITSQHIAHLVIHVSRYSF